MQKSLYVELSYFTKSIKFTLNKLRPIEIMLCVALYPNMQLHFENVFVH